MTLWTLLLLAGVAGAAVSQAPAAQERSDEGAQVSRSRSASADKGRAPLVFISSPQQRIWKGEKISLSLKDADLVEVLRSFAKLTEINLVIDPTVTGKVTAELHDVPLDQALAVILKTHQLGAELDGRVLSVARTSR